MQATFQIAGFTFVPSLSWSPLIGTLADGVTPKPLLLNSDGSLAAPSAGEDVNLAKVGGAAYALGAAAAAASMPVVPVGDTLSGATDSGSAPLKIGAVNRTTLPTLTDGQRGELQVNTRGILLTGLVNGATPAQFGPTNADAIVVISSNSAIFTLAHTLGWNGTTWDRVKINTLGALKIEDAPRQLTGTPSNFTVATADGTVFTLAAGEVGFIQNLDSADALAVKRGANCSTSSFSFILPCGSAQDNGTGGLVIIDDWVGVVSVATMTGAGRYIAWKSS